MIKRSIVTCIFVPLMTSIGASALLAIPGEAFTLSTSEATFKIDRLSDLPLDVQTFQDANTQSIAPSGLVESNANANATFLTDQLNPSSSQANGFSSSAVSGSGNHYSGFAQSVAQVIGYSFQVESGAMFSLDFNTSLNLYTSIDQPGIETATAIGNISLGLYDVTDPNKLTLLDFVTIASYLDTPGNSHTLTVNQSTGITFSFNQTSLNTLAGGKQASASASVQGNLSRSFSRPTSLTLVKFSFNQATVAVPEPSSILASFLGISLIGIRFWLKVKPNQKS